jgi:hypothetical protein
MDKEQFTRRGVLCGVGAGVGASVMSRQVVGQNTRLSYEEATTGTVGDSIVFAAEEGELISIDVRIDRPVDNEIEIELIQPNGDLATSVRGNAEDGNAAITLHTIERTRGGDYTINLNSTFDSADDTFGYELSLHEGIPADQEIIYADSVSNEITRENRYYNDFYLSGYHETYSFEAAEQDQITIEMRPSNELDNDAQLALYDPNGELADYDTNQNGEDGNAVITQYEVERQQGGEYTIAATGADYTDRFSYELFLYEGIPTDQEIAYGDAISSKITRENRYYRDFYLSGYHETYSFEAAEQDQITIEMRPNDEINNDAQLALYNPDGELTAYDVDQNGEDGNAVITQHEVERQQDGEYTIAATGADSTELFSYDIYLYEGIPIDQEITYGDSISSEITREDRYYRDFYFSGYHETYSFEAQNDNVVTIQMQPDNAIDNDAQLALYNPDGELTTYDVTQSGKEGTAIIEQYAVEQEGKYTLVATGGRTSELFPYTLDLTLADGTPPNGTPELQLQQPKITDTTVESTIPAEITVTETTGVVAEDVSMTLTVLTPTDTTVYNETINIGQISDEATVIFGADRSTPEIGPFETAGEYQATIQATAAAADTVSATDTFSVSDSTSPDEDNNNLVTDYTNEQGTVDTAGLIQAINDWRNGETETTTLLEVITAWRSGGPIA